MKYVTVSSDALFDRLIMSIDALCDANAWMMQNPLTGSTHGFELPSCEVDAWEGEQEDVLSPLGFVSIYYQKVNNPNADDFKPRQLMPVEMYESKAGHLLMRAYDFNAGFVKSFRLDAVQRIMIRNHRMGDDEWGLRDITFRGRSAVAD